MASRGRPSKRGTPFDRLIKQQCQKGRFGVGVNKSAGMVHGKWGSTSFTSMRTVNGIGSKIETSSNYQSNNIYDPDVEVPKQRDWPPQEQQPKVNNTSVYNAPRPKKFFKSRDTAPPSHEKGPEVNLGPISDTNTQKKITSLPTTEIKASKHWKKAELSKEDSNVSEEVIPKNNSHKRSKYRNEPTGILSPNQLQHIDDEPPPKKSNKKFFTSKQRNPDANIEKTRATRSKEALPVDVNEDRENVPRVPPLKLRIKAANAAALSAESSQQDVSDSENLVKTNNNETDDTNQLHGDCKDITGPNLAIHSNVDNVDSIDHMQVSADITTTKTTRRGRKPTIVPSQKEEKSSNKKKNEFDKNTLVDENVDVPDVAGGTRNNRKVLQPTTLPLVKDNSSVSVDPPRSTRSRLRGVNRGDVDYNEEKSDEYLDSVCEGRVSQETMSSTNNTMETNTKASAEKVNRQAPNADSSSKMSFNNKFDQIEPSTYLGASHFKDEINTKQDTVDKDWTMEDIDNFYTKVDEKEIIDSHNNLVSVRAQEEHNDNEAGDKVDARSYTRKRKQKQAGMLENKKETLDKECTKSEMIGKDQASNLCLDERVPNQKDITKKAATTSTQLNNSDSESGHSMQNIVENSKTHEAFNRTLNTKQTDSFSIETLADLKGEKTEQSGQNDNQPSAVSKCAMSEANDKLSSTKPVKELGQGKLETEDDSDFYSKLMETKSQFTQKSGFKSFSLSSKQPNTGAAGEVTTGASAMIKKRSIFKSKAQAISGPTTGNGNQTSGQGSKGRSLYKHKFGANNDESQQEEPSFRAKVLQRALTMPSTSTNSLDFDETEFNDGATSTAEMSFSSNRLIRVPTVTGGSTTSTLPGFDETLQEVVSVKCPKAQKTYYQVIKKTKKAHQIQDSGEFQEFNDDVDYIQEGLGRHNNLSTRCLSTVTLASKCMEPPFRMHLRAHGTVTKFFAELKDAPKNPSLALCTSTVLFVLSQDRLNMDLDRESLELMLNLLDTDSRIKDALDGAGLNPRELEKNKSKVQELVAAMKAKGRATNLSLEHISADHLAMETLLSMTSKRAGEWFKEELRELGGLDHLVRTMSDCLSFLTADEISIWTEPLHNKLKKVDRVLKVLESVTHENEENCQYLLEYEEGKFLDTIHSFFKLLDEEVPLNSDVSSHIGSQIVLEKEDKDSVAYTLRESLLDIIRVYINLVHDYKSIPHGSRLSGEKEGIFDLCLHGMFVIPHYLPEEKRFDILVLTLTLIINLVENCYPNRAILMKTAVPEKSDNMFTVNERKLAPEGLIQMFLEREENARRLETKTDKILDGKGDEDEQSASIKAPESESKGQEKEEDTADTALVVKKNNAGAHASYGSKSKADSNSNTKNNKNDNTNAQKSHEEFIDETVKKLLEKAGSHMEDTLVASYLTLIIGYLILENNEHEEIVRQLMPEKNFSLMVAVLKKFYNFMNLTASASVTSTRGLKATEMILKYLEKADQEPEEKKQEEMKQNRSSIDLQDDNFDDLTLFDVTKDEDDDLDDTSHAGSRSDRSRNSESSFLDMKSPNFDDFGKL